VIVADPSPAATFEIVGIPGAASVHDAMYVALALPIVALVVLIEIGVPATLHPPNTYPVREGLVGKLTELPVVPERAAGVVPSPPFKSKKIEKLLFFHCAIAEIAEVTTIEAPAPYLLDPISHPSKMVQPELCQIRVFNTEALTRYLALLD